MPSFFSGTDDKYELGDPGIHIVVGSINSKTRRYSIAASVVGSGRRFKIPYSAILDSSPNDNCSFHSDVLSYVKYEEPKVREKRYFLPSNNQYQQYHKWQSNNNIFNNFTDEEKDPFHFSDQTPKKHNEKVSLWNVEDPIDDYMREHSDYPEKLKDLKAILQTYIDDIDILEELNSSQLIPC